MKTPENDLRLEILNTLLTTPHRQLDQIWPVHRDLVAKDPRFYVRLAAWYHDHGDVRDHKEMFCVTLALSAFEGHRDVGLALMRQLPPYQVARVLDFVHGRKTYKSARPKGTGKGKKAAAEATIPAEAVKVVEDFGLFRNVPRSLRTEVERYLREREAEPDWFDSTALTARKALKRLYAVLHIKPGERAQKILFDEQPPAGSRLAALKALAKAAAPEEQASLIRAERIPYRVAATVVQRMTPAVLHALVDVMTPQELINNLAALKRRGGLDDPAVKQAVEAKLAEAKSGARVSAFKAEEAMKAADLSADVRRSLEQVADTQIKAKGRITRPTALLIDKSGSMSVAIELGKRIGAMISSVCEKELFVYAFDTMAYPIDRAGEDIASWERALMGITAGGGTSCGVSIQAMMLKKQYVEQIILVTDEQENTGPHFAPTLQKYRETLNADPSICIVRTPGGSSGIETQCRNAGLMVDVFQFAGDYYSLPNLIPFLSKPSKLELLMEIMEYPLPERKSA